MLYFHRGYHSTPIPSMLEPTLLAHLLGSVFPTLSAVNRANVADLLIVLATATTLSDQAHDTAHSAPAVAALLGAIDSAPALDWISRMHCGDAADTVSAATALGAVLQQRQRFRIARPVYEHALTIAQVTP